MSTKSGKAKLMSSPFFHEYSSRRRVNYFLWPAARHTERERSLSLMFGMAISISQSHCWHQGRTIIMSAFLSFVAAAAAATSLRPFLACP